MLDQWAPLADSVSAVVSLALVLHHRDRADRRRVAERLCRGHPSRGQLGLMLLNDGKPLLRPRVHGLRLGRQRRPEGRGRDGRQPGRHRRTGNGRRHPRRRR
jgi:hypothetical protein